jgi:crotonobetainyl-CoA:carnitine CoA-transferase CaiB-like acyl-CoA transferase
VLQPFPSLAKARIADLSDRWGQFTSKLLAQLGADVVLFEPCRGRAERRSRPYAALDDGELISLYFWHFNIGKRSVASSSDDVIGELASIIARADVVLLGLEALQELEARAPQVLAQTNQVVISPFGSGAGAPASSSDLHVSAASAMAGLSGYGSDEASEPIIPAGEQTIHAAGLYGAIAALLALRPQIRRSGQRFDVSGQASAFQSTEQAFAYASYRGEDLYRRAGGYATAFPSPRWQRTASDGAPVYCFGLLPRSQREWDSLRAWMREEGALGELDDPRFDNINALRGRSTMDTSPAGLYALERIGHFVESMPAERVYRKGQALGLSWARIYQPADTLCEEQYHSRGFFHPTRWPGDSNTYLTTSLPWITSGARFDTSGPPLAPPRLGDATSEVLEEWSR